MTLWPHPGSYKIKSATLFCSRDKLGCAFLSESSLCMYFLYNSLSIWALGPHTAGPLLLLSILNCTPARSVTLPISPSRASISFTRMPLPTPPIEGLHEHLPISVKDGVMRVVCAPVLDDAAAASQPACPAPMTTTCVLVVGWKLVKKDMVNRLLRTCKGNEVHEDAKVVTRSIVLWGV
ncbi:AVN_HP_G0071390.mRNA.1.CDS.1 [Saccharomyces cerevisiae]|nr:AVN_HP_G0071390.mRNA.1.CDS.1 [Saccharomyces cerevisiae]CAI6947836.1 AVN_HP_G0071390.mRNA.1.CDS.1 [Saccharomyces cerevisiae]